MFQAGVKNIKLYENKGINFNFWDAEDLNKITDINAGGQIINIENMQQPEFEIKSKLSNSGNIVFEYSAKFFMFGLTIDNFSLIEILSDTLYGWCALVEFYDGTMRFFNTPIFMPETEIKPHEEMTFEIKMETKVPTKQKYFEYTPNISTVPVYRADTTLVTADTTIYTADYGL
jgi:hypothetical protein